MAVYPLYHYLSLFKCKEGINPRHHVFRSTNASNKGTSDLPSASSLSKVPDCFESTPLIKEENYGALLSAKISSYQLQDILNLKVFTSNDEDDCAVFIANVLNGSKSEGVQFVVKKTARDRELLKHVECSFQGSRYLIEVRTQLKQAKKHLMPWLCSTTIMPDISLYKLINTTTQKSDLPIAIFEVISDTPWQTSRQLAIKLVELLRLFKAYDHDIPELTGVVLPRSKSQTQLPTINESPEKISSSDMEIIAGVVEMKISDTGTGSASKSTPSNHSQSFAVKVRVQFDCKLLKFVISYQPLQSTEVKDAVLNALLDIEIQSHSNSNFFKLSEQELEQIKGNLSVVKFFQMYKGLEKSVALQQLYSRTSLVFKAQTGMDKEIVLKVFARGGPEFMQFEGFAKNLNLQHALLSEGIVFLGASGPLVFVFECLPQLSKHEAKDRIRVVLEAIKLAVDELHSSNVAHLDIRLPNICFKSTSGGNDDRLNAVFIDLERAKCEIKSSLLESYSSCMYKTGWTLEEIDFLQVYWMALWLLLDDVHVSKCSCKLQHLLFQVLLEGLSLLRSFVSWSLPLPSEDKIGGGVPYSRGGKPSNSRKWIKELSPGATDLRNKFLPCIDHLFDENLLIGSGWTTRESVSSCQWPSTCLLKMNVHDDTIPVSIQMMSCKVLLNLVESIRVKSEQDTGARELLDGGVHTQVQSHSAVPDPRTVQTLSAITQ
ncbi:hypothetical protein EMCRGX_G032176 [Ephydatia muelleri]